MVRKIELRLCHGISASGGESSFARTVLLGDSSRSPPAYCSSLLKAFLTVGILDYREPGHPAAREAIHPGEESN